MLALTGHRFYALQGGNLKRWNPTFAAVPPNYTILDGSLRQDQVPMDLGIDVVLTHTRLDQFRFGNQYRVARNVPHVALEHVLPLPGVRERVGRYRGDVDVFISEYSRDAWGFSAADSVVVEHAVDADTFAPEPGVARRPVCLSVVNDWIRRDHECGYRFWRAATDGLPVAVVGDTPGLSVPARDLDDLALHYKTSLVFANTSQVSPIPTSLLEAMAAGCAVVTTRNPMIDSVVVDGLSGFLVDSPGEMREIVEGLLENPHIAREVGERGRGEVLSRFGVGRFVSEWKGVFERAASTVLTSWEKAA